MAEMIATGRHCRVGGIGCGFSKNAFNQKRLQITGLLQGWRNRLQAPVVRGLKLSAQPPSAARGG
jgi:hypothetical protein